MISRKLPGAIMAVMRSKSWKNGEGKEKESEFMRERAKRFRGGAC